MADQIIMNLSGEGQPANLVPDTPLGEQGVENESILVLDIRPGAPYFLKVQVSPAETIDLPYKFNDTIEKLKEAL